jgi:hypothetical protein
MALPRATLCCCPPLSCLGFLSRSSSICSNCATGQRSFHTRGPPRSFAQPWARQDPPCILPLGADSRDRAAQLLGIRYQSKLGPCPQFSPRRRRLPALLKAFEQKVERSTQTCFPFSRRKSSALLARRSK